MSTDRPVHISALLVEDDLDHSALLRRAFEKAGYPDALRVVTDVEAAKAYLVGQSPHDDKIRFQSPSFVLLDLRLPGAPGVTLIEWMRQQPQLRSTPVIVLTAFSESHEVSRAYELGASSYLIKPVGFEELCSMVRSVALYWGVLNTAGSKH